MSHSMLKCEIEIVHSFAGNVCSVGSTLPNWTLIVHAEAHAPACQPMIHTDWRFGNIATTPEQHRTQHYTYLNHPVISLYLISCLCPDIAQGIHYLWIPFLLPGLQLGIWGWHGATSRGENLTSFAGSKILQYSNWTFYSVPLQVSQCVQILYRIKA